MMKEGRSSVNLEEGREKGKETKKNRETKEGKRGSGKWKGGLG